VARGNIAYSAVNHPCPVFLKNGGTRSSSEAEQTTRVLPIAISTEPSAYGRKPGVMHTGRSSSEARPSVRAKLIVSPNLYGFKYGRSRTQKSFGYFSKSFGCIGHIKVIEIITELPFLVKAGSIFVS
jgi:hypothetical protein